MKRIRHIPDVSRIGWTYCGRGWLKFDGSTRLPIIDLQRDCIEDAECRACQRSDDRRTREAYIREIHEKALAQRAKTAALRSHPSACDCIDCSIAGEPTH